MEITKIDWEWQTKNIYLNFFFFCYEDTEPRHRFADFECTFTKAKFNEVKSHLQRLGCEHVAWLRSHPGQTAEKQTTAKFLLEWGKMNVTKKSFRQILKCLDSVRFEGEAVRTYLEMGEVKSNILRKIEV